MDVLNQHFDFDRDASSDDKAAFWGAPQKTVLLPRARLHRLVTLEGGGVRGNELFLSPWWYPVETWHELKRIAQSSSQPLPAVARTHLAVQEGWNKNLNWLCSIDLKKPAWAWRGKIRYQPTAPGSRIFLMGGLDQVYLPNLARGPRNTLESNASEYAEIIYFGTIPDF